METPYHTLVAKLTELEQSLVYTQNDYRGRGDTNEYRAGAEWEMLNRTLGDASAAVRALEPLDQTFEQRIEAVRDERLAGRAQPARRDALDERREIIDDLLITTRTLLRFVNFDGRSETPIQRDPKAMCVRDYEESDARLICALERIIHKQRAWTEDRMNAWLGSDDWKQGVSDIRILEDCEDPTKPRLIGYYAWRRDELPVRYVRSARPAESRVQHLVIESGTTVGSYRNHGVDRVVSFILRDLKDAGIFRLADGVDEAHK